MILAGGNMVINGLWALHSSSQVEKIFGDTLLFSSSNLDTWGWIYLIVGAVVVVAGILVFFRAAFGIWIGIIAALVQAFFAFFWIFSPYWPGCADHHRSRPAGDLRPQQPAVRRPRVRLRTTLPMPGTVRCGGCRTDPRAVPSRLPASGVQVVDLALPMPR